MGFCSDDEYQEFMRSCPEFERMLVRSGIILTGANWAWMGSDTLSKLGSEQNGILTALEVSQLNLKKTRLVVLSACQTGLGKIEDSEGTFGLKRGFGPFRK